MSLSLTDDWSQLTIQANTHELRNLALDWCTKVENTVPCGDIQALHVLMEMHSQFVRRIQPVVTTELLVPFIKQKGFLIELFGLSTDATFVTRRTFWFEDDAKRRAALNNLAQMKMHSAIALLEAQPSCQNRFWEIVKTDSTNGGLVESAKWLSLLTGMGHISLRPYACETHQMYYWIGRSLRDTIDWSEDRRTLVKNSIAALAREPKSFVIDNLVKAIEYAVRNQWRMVAIGALCQKEKPSPFEAMACLMPRSGFDWHAAESLGVSFVDAAEQAKATPATVVQVALPSTLLV